jgi:hypothetical protein
MLSKETVKSRKVIIWGRPDVLSWAVEFFLSARKDWEIFSLSNERSVDNLFCEVEKMQPEAVIIYQRTCARSAYLPAQLLLNYPNLSVITVNPDDNSMEVYSKKQIFIHEVSDLISVVEGELHPVQ